MVLRKNSSPAKTNSFAKRAASSNQTIGEALFISLIHASETTHQLKQIHSQIIVQRLWQSSWLTTQLISSSLLLKSVDYALSVFRHSVQQNTFIFNALIRGLAENTRFESSISHFVTMLRMNIRPDRLTFPFVLKSTAALYISSFGRSLHAKIVNLGIECDSFVRVSLVDMYVKIDLLEFALQLFDESTDTMKLGSILLWNVLITGCCKVGDMNKASELFEAMPERNIGSWNSLINGFMRNGDLERAVNLFDVMEERNLISWTTMVTGFSLNGNHERALLVFFTMLENGVGPNDLTVVSALSACARIGALETGIRIHNHLLGNNFRFNKAVRNALVDMYSKFHMTREAHFMFESIEEKDLISWNSIISGFSQNGFSYETLELFHLMRLNSFSPDAVTIVSVLSSCASLGCLHMGSSLHACSVKEGFELSNVYIGTSLINFYAKCGDPISARKIFDEMEEKTAITWSAIIGGYGMHGDSCESIALFDKMLKERSEPNDVIFTTILTACSHTGKIGEGWKYFNLMCHNYNFLPSMKHYACMVDLLARSGRLEEALEFVDKLTVKPSLSLMGAFLHGCVLHSRFDLAEATMRRILEMHPDEASYYVLMSNLYTSNGRWREANQVRELLKRRGLVKCYGCSVVDMDIGDECYPLKVASLT